MSVATILDESDLNTPDTDDFDSKLIPGSPATDAPVKINGKESWFLKAIGTDFTGIYFAKEGADIPEGASELAEDDIPVKTLVVSDMDVAGNGTLLDSKGLLKQRLDGQPGTYYLFRPDQHVVARWRDFDLKSVRDAVARATMQTG